MSKILTYGDAAPVRSLTALRLYGKVGIMNALPSTKWLALGLGVYALATLACSAEASSAPPGNGSQAGSGGSGPVNMAGTTGLPTAGTTGVGTAGTTGVGTAGTTGVGTAGTTGGGTGGMMGGSLAACPVPPAAGAVTDLLIDDLEDGDNGVAKVGNRTGFWYTYVDALGSMIVPKPDPSGAIPLKPGTTNCHGGTSCILISGATVANMEDLVTPANSKYAFAGVGFDLSNAKKPCVYNASAYTGIKFWVRGDAPVIQVKLNTTATADATGGGTCAVECNGGFSPAGVDIVLTGEWQQVDLNFAMAKEPAWVVTPKTLDKAALLGMQVQVPPATTTFTVAVDDLTFY